MLTRRDAAELRDMLRSLNYEQRASLLDTLAAVVAATCEVISHSMVFAPIDIDPVEFVAECLDEAIA